MEPALDVITRALHGDPGARSFLEQTTSIYILDVTDRSKPKTYGCWNFIHQAMNEIERHETRHTRQNNGIDKTESALVGHTRLLATMALRVARRPPATDKLLVATCISNASEYTGNESDSQWLIEINLELREIVMGRIAAMALDFSFHRKSGQHGSSAFGDRVVMDTFCAILSANAVASGPGAIRQFATEWIIPSCRNLPAFAVASVVLHLAGEGARKSARKGTKDALQQLSVAALQSVVLPILSDALSESSNEFSVSKVAHEENSLVAAMCLKAMKAWCDATDLSLPQMKHICNKIDADFIGVICDSMYSDSFLVIDALAGFLESTVLISDQKVMSEGRMNQARHIIGVDEATFKSQLSQEQLKSIESSEMSVIVDELVSGVGLQRFRFTERQNNGDYDVCCNLARIAACVCSTWLDVSHQESVRQPDRGAITLLMKASAHPAINICAIALDVLSRMMNVVPVLAQELLPILQRRAITPHHLRNNRLSLDATDLCGVNFDEFQNFRESVLREALVASWKSYSDHFMDSCTSAVEEFCASQSLPIEVSLQLEAALFCIEKVGSESLSTIEDYPHDAQVRRVLAALSRNPASVSVNLLTRARMCRFICTYASWIGENGLIDMAAELVFASFKDSLMMNSATDSSNELEEFEISPTTQAATAINSLLSSYPRFFTIEARVASLKSLWDITYVTTEIQKKSVAIEARLSLCKGFSAVVAALPEGQAGLLLKDLASKPLDRLDRLVKLGQPFDMANLLTAQLGASYEIRILAELTQRFTNPLSVGPAQRQEVNARIVMPIIDIVGQGWHNITFVAGNWSTEKNIASSLFTFLSNLLPMTCDDDGSINLLKEICAIISSVRANALSKSEPFQEMFDLIGVCIDLYGTNIEKGVVASMAGKEILKCDHEVKRLVEDLIVTNVSSAKESLGTVWALPREQKNGQDAFESKPSPRRKPVVKSNESLSAVLNMLTKCLVKCPLFSIYLPAAPGIENDSDMLLRRAVDSAVDCLSAGDPEITNAAILFIKTLADHRCSAYEALQSFSVDSLARIREDCISRLILISCAKIAFNQLRNVTELVLILLRTSNLSDVKSILLTAFAQDQFLLGEKAKDAAIMTLFRWSDGLHQMQLDDCHKFLEDIWMLHQVEDTDSLPASDEVDRFILRYSY